MIDGAERHWAVLPDYALQRARLFAEKLVEELSRQAENSPRRSFYTQVLALQKSGRLGVEHVESFDFVRQRGNRAVHDGSGRAELAREALSHCWRLTALICEEAASVSYRPPPGTEGSSDADLFAALRDATLRSDLRLSIPARRAGDERPTTVEEVFVPSWVAEGDRVLAWSELVDRLIGGERYLLTGAAGEGKSTHTRALVAMLARSETGPVPVYIPARGTTGRSITGAAAARVQFELGVPLSEDRLVEWLRTGEAMLVVDGLDECGARQRETLLSNLESASQYAGAGILVTSRPLASLDGGVGAFTHARLVGWSPEDLFEYLARAGAASGRPIEDARATLEKQTSIVEVGRQPLLGALLVESLLSSSESASGEMELMDRGLDLMLRRRPEARGPGLESLASGEFVALVESLALADAQRELEPSFEAWSRHVSENSTRDILLAEDLVAYMLHETGIAFSHGADGVSFSHLLLRDRLATRAAFRVGVEPVALIAATGATWLSPFQVSLAVEAARRDPTFLESLHRVYSERSFAPSSPGFNAVALPWGLPFAQILDEGAALEPALARGLLTELVQDCSRFTRVRGESDDGPKLLPVPVEHAAWLQRVGDEASRQVLEPILRQGTGELLVGAVALALEGYGAEWVRGHLLWRPDLGEIDELMVFWPHSWIGTTRKAERHPAKGHEVGDLVAERLSATAATRVVSRWVGADWLPAVFAVLDFPASAELVEAVAGWVLEQALCGGLDPKALADRQRAATRGLDVVAGSGRARAPLVPVLEGCPVERHEETAPDQAPTWMRLHTRADKTDLLMLSSLLPDAPRTWIDLPRLDAAPIQRGAFDIGNQLGSAAVALVGQHTLILEMSDAGAGGLGVAELFTPIETSLERSAPRGPLVPRAIRPMEAIVQPAQRDGHPHHARAVRTADWIAAALFTRGLPHASRLSHLRHRISCRSALDAWPAFEVALGTWEQVWKGDPAGEAIAMAMAYAIGASTGTWPPYQEQVDRMKRRPEHWLARVAWHLCRLAAGGPERRHRGGVLRALAARKDHPVGEVLRHRLGLDGHRARGTGRPRCR